MNITYIDQFEKTYKNLPATAYNKSIQLESMLYIASLLEQVIVEPGKNPFQPLESLFQFLTEKLQRAASIATEFGKPHARREREEKAPQDRTKTLFENAWTVYSDETYDHSVSLVRDRLEASGVSSATIRNSICFDGGCGTGRLSIALASMGAKKVVAADFGDASLSFFQKQIKRYGLRNIETVCADITDLRDFTSDSFDFVASNGVLHHTPRCLPGLDEHWRIVKPGGKLWLYLYGAGGCYWPIYDRMRALLDGVSTQDFRDVMLHLGVREGLVYTMLDNLFAPREYFLASEIIKRLGKQHDLTWQHQDGPAIFDNPSRYIETKYGKDILGPEGEVRLVIEKTP